LYNLIFPSQHLYVHIVKLNPSVDERKQNLTIDGVYFNCLLYILIFGSIHFLRQIEPKPFLKLAEKQPPCRFLAFPTPACLLGGLFAKTKLVSVG
jgi:hypothetical protein